VTLVDGREGYNSDEIRDISHNCGMKFLNKILSSAGIDFCFSLHYGDFDPSRESYPLCSDGQFAGLSEDLVSEPRLLREGMPMRYTFWLAEDCYFRNAELIVSTRKDIEQAT